MSVWKNCITYFYNGLIIKSGQFLLEGNSRVKNYGKIFTSQELQRGVLPPTSGTLGNFSYEEYTINDDSIFNFHSLNRREPGTDIEIVIKWAIDEAYSENSGKIQWQVEWASLPADNSEAVDSPSNSGTVKSGDINIPANAKYLTETFLIIPGSDIEQEEEVGIILKRIAIDTGSNPVAEPGVICVGVQHITNKLGRAL